MTSYLDKYVHASARIEEAEAEHSTAISRLEGATQAAQERIRNYNGDDGNAPTAVADQFDSAVLQQEVECSKT